MFVTTLPLDYSCSSLYIFIIWLSHSCLRVSLVTLLANLLLIVHYSDRVALSRTTISNSWYQSCKFFSDAGHLCFYIFCCMIFYICITKG